MSDFDVVLTGRAVPTDRGREKGYVAIRGGVVERVGEGAPPAATCREDFGAALILPGAIDAPKERAEPAALGAGAATILQAVLQPGRGRENETVRTTERRQSHA